MRVAAPPAEGAANRAVVALLAGELGVGRGAVVVERGATSRTKTIRADGVPAAEVVARWPGVAAQDVR